MDNKKKNSKFLQINKTPISNGSEWDLRVFSPVDNFVTQICTVYDFVDFSASLVLCDVGGGAVSLDLDSPFMNETLPNGANPLTLLGTGLLWRAYESGVLRFEWITKTVSINQTGDAGSRIATLSGEGSGSVLKRGKVLPPGFPAQTTSSWVFKNQSRMKSWHALYAASVARGTIPYVNLMFTATKDSNGIPWSDTPTKTSTVTDYTPELNEDLLSILQEATGQDYDKLAAMRLDWIMWPGFHLDVRPTIGSNKENMIIFNDGGSTIYRTADRDISDLANYIAVRDSYGKTALAKSKASITQYGQVEELHDYGDITNPKLKGRIADTILEMLKDGVSSWTIKIQPNVPGRKIFRDFNVGDWVGVDEFNVNTGVSTITAYRIVGIAVSKSNSTYDVELTIQSKFDIKMKRLRDTLTKIINQPANGGKLPPVPPYDGPDDEYNRTLPDYENIKPLYGLTPYNGRWGVSGINAFNFYEQPDEPVDAPVHSFWLDTSYEVF